MTASFASTALSLTLAHAWQVEVYRVNTARELHEAYARIYGVPFVPGMFAKAPLPFYPPGTARSHISVRTCLSRAPQTTTRIRPATTALICRCARRSCSAFASKRCASRRMTRARCDYRLTLFAQAAQLDPALNAAFAALPAHFDARDWPQWQHFFARYPAHYTDAAYAGGRVTLSSVTRLALPQVGAQWPLRCRIDATLIVVMRSGSE